MLEKREDKQDFIHWYIGITIMMGISDIRHTMAELYQYGKFSEVLAEHLAEN